MLPFQKLIREQKGMPEAARATDKYNYVISISGIEL
jgi:hypothetical protein